MCLMLDNSKVLWYKNKVKEWLKTGRGKIITIDMALTQACNYNCIYCYSKNFQQRKGNRITLPIMKGFLDDCAEMGVKGISLVSDGESTCNPIYSDVIVYGKDKGIDMALGTNGYLLDKKILEKILPKLTYIRINMSAGTPQSYAHIHGVTVEHYERVIWNICDMVEIKKKKKLDVTIGLQMVLMPQFEDQIMPLVKLGKKLGVDYLVIKHCSDEDSERSLGVDYSKYKEMADILREAEQYSTDNYTVKVKWNKLNDGNKRSYEQCYGVQFHAQISGSGLVAPCGCLFGDRYKRYHIGDFTKQRYKDIINSDRYREVMDHLASEKFNAKKECPFLCVQHLTNKVLDNIKKKKIEVKNPFRQEPQHSSFI